MPEIETDRAWVDAMDHRGADVFFNALAQTGDLARRNAVDMFARDGILTVSRYFDKVKSLDLWEYNPDFEEDLKKVPGVGEIIIGDSYETVRNTTKKYDFIVVDTPQGMYDTTRGTVAEHFDFIPLLPDVMSDDCVVVVYVNKVPYSRDDVGNFGRDRYATHSHDLWMYHRKVFYGEANISEELALHAYRRQFRRGGFSLHNVLITPCWDSLPGLPTSFRLAMWLKKG